MIVGFDVDGVIARAPLNLDRLLRYFARGWNLMLSTPLGKFLYNNFRYVDKGTRQILCQLQESGHEIIIATYVFEKHRNLVERWLKNNGIPFNKLTLAEKEESASEFKVRAVLEESCDYFVDDNISLARAISQKVPGVRVIHYSDKEDLSILLS